MVRQAITRKVPRRAPGFESASLATPATIAFPCKPPPRAWAYRATRPILPSSSWLAAPPLPGSPQPVSISSRGEAEAGEKDLAMLGFPIVAGVRHDDRGDRAQPPDDVAGIIEAPQMGVA